MVLPGGETGARVVDGAVELVVCRLELVVGAAVELDRPVVVPVVAADDPAGPGGPTGPCGPAGPATGAVVALEDVVGAAGVGVSVRRTRACVPRTTARITSRIATMPASR